MWVESQPTATPRKECYMIATILYMTMMVNTQSIKIEDKTRFNVDCGDVSYLTDGIRLKSAINIANREASCRKKRTCHFFSRKDKKKVVLELNGVEVPLKWKSNEGYSRVYVPNTRIKKYVKDLKCKR